VVILALFNNIVIIGRLYIVGHYRLFSSAAQTAQYVLYDTHTIGLNTKHAEYNEYSENDQKKLI